MRFNNYIQQISLKNSHFIYKQKTNKIIFKFIFDHV